MKHDEAQKLITKARANIFLDHGFFGYMLAKHEIRLTDSVPTLAVDARRNIYVNPDFILKFKHDNKKIQWALCHEIMHPILMHLTRRGSRDPRIWNYAGDAVINDLLNHSKVGTPIEGTVDMPGSRERTTEDIYRDLEQKAQQQSGGGGASGGSGSGDPSLDNGLGEDIMEGELTDAERAQAEIQARIDIAQAAAAARTRGQLSGALRAFVDNILESQVPWFDKLHEFMQGMQRNEYSWSRPNRRFISQGHYLPSSGVIPKMGTVVIQVDVSGSVTRSEAAHFGGHVQRIAAECQPESIHVLYTDSQVLRHDVFNTAEEVEFNFFTAGGTNMAAGFDYCAEHDIEPDVFITLTDGGTPWGDPPPYPVVWCVSSDHYQPTHGIHIPFKVTQ